MEMNWKSIENEKNKVGRINDLPINSNHRRNRHPMSDLWKLV